MDVRLSATVRRTKDLMSGGEMWKGLLAVAAVVTALLMSPVLPRAAEPLPRAASPEEVGLSSERLDVNGDGFGDLVVHVEAADLELSASDVIAELTASTFGGRVVFGFDSIRIER